MNTVYIGLGANLYEPQAQLKKAVEALHNHPDIKDMTVSSFYASKPMGPQDQPDYVNAVAKFSTMLEPEPLLDQLQLIEQQQGRVRKDERWGPRTLDLDILLFNEAIIDSPRLTIPHYGLCDREFVVFPMLEINSKLCLPNGTTLSDIAANLPRNGLTTLPVTQNKET
ncbi:2-amino-4-hydroxy-6-hydroxymethyldihydropteridine diphosphokinase [Pseudoalteromonas luteoviolacea]|uniref:2-amino-4-hydroxy-6- hydroxymethyldihydropteridine diphosphokinase n=1 Tax=Pseudoalteromonas luteoviolacea TaxID=43657 RepID=UPI001B389E25|nr:2-amino-4-hydroxy-6-hydroxymethyldihydropteridine diphosphokinase [Pseudoalteromonas luteoviolacea]MBQ4813636.1 2-amino-4-hydroxy-6-hydroxymethyldihydropteridine diphosphokinase [Pseudoalteromonas luteoviolacea]